jgi:hypothetical protein
LTKGRRLGRPEAEARPTLPKLVFKELPQAPRQGNCGDAVRAKG